MPTGVAVRAISPLLGHKSSDPAVVCLDEAGQSVIPLLGGHQAGANDLSRQIANLTGGHAAITTASDVQGKPALDTPPYPPLKRGGSKGEVNIASGSALTYASACLVNDDPIGFYVDPALPTLHQLVTRWLSSAGNITLVNSLDDLDLDAYAAGLIFTHRAISPHHLHLLSKSVLYRPAVLVAGLGCKRGVPVDELRNALNTTFQDADLSLESLAQLATVDLKADEPSLRELAVELNVPLKIIRSADLKKLEPASFSPSAAHEKFDLPGVAEPCAVLAAGANGEIIVPKRAFKSCTVAVAIADFEFNVSDIEADEE